MTKSTPLLFLLGVFALFLCPLQAQDDFSLPGDEAPVVVNTPGSDPAAAADAGVEQKRESLLDMIKAGGWAMIPLFIMLFAVIALSVYMLLDLKKNTFSPKKVIEAMQASAEAGDINGITESARGSASCLGQVMNGACEYIYDRGYGVLNGDSIFDQMSDASLDFNRKRVSLLNYLSVISQAAPMVGLLGTVSGMIKAFATLKQAGMGDPGQLAGNISEALVTTASGLIVALPAIFMYFFFRDKMVALVADVDKNCAKILNSLRRAVLGNQQQAAVAAPEPPQQQHPLS
ncbi:MAG: MotA/TolQ/ExbB proton channel family protein [Verrucomicrobiales bacterium]|nr:MotA/TolQ/ExbB proton channel family protein [Verrucomicrobiales bacterium]